LSINFKENNSPLENIIEILKYIGPFVGVYIGWLLRQKSEKHKIKYEEQKRIKNTLFNMLEIRNGLLQSKRIDRMLRVLIPKIKAHPKFNQEEEINPIEFKNFIRKLLLNFNDDNHEINFNQKFKQSVENLSEINPILAFKINGKQNVRKYVDGWEMESRNIMDSENVEGVEEALEAYKPKLIDEIDFDLTEIILEIADLITEDQIKEDAKEMITKKNEKESESDFSEYIDRMFAEIK
jgi:hypothetical protein